MFQTALVPIGAVLVQSRGTYRIAPADQAATGVIATGNGPADNAIAGNGMCRGACASGRAASAVSECKRGDRSYAVARGCPAAHRPAIAHDYRAGHARVQVAEVREHAGLIELVRHRLPLCYLLVCAPAVRHAGHRVRCRVAVRPRHLVPCLNAHHRGREATLTQLDGRLRLIAEDVAVAPATRLRRRPSGQRERAHAQRQSHRCHSMHCAYLLSRLFWEIYTGGMRLVPNASSRSGLAVNRLPSG